MTIKYVQYVILFTICVTYHDFFLLHILTAAFPTARLSRPSVRGPGLEMGVWSLSMQMRGDSINKAGQSLCNTNILQTNFIRMTIEYVQYVLLFTTCHT